MSETRRCFTASIDAGGMEQGQAFLRMECHRLQEQLEVPLGPEWRVAGTAARDTEEKNRHSSVWQNHIV
jgi:hypothetical protein